MPANESPPGPAAGGASPGAARARGAHVIVCGNEKGGSGKSTLAVHLAVALLHEGCSVATIDLDSRQQTLTRYLENRRRTAEGAGESVPMPYHVRIERSDADGRAEADGHERGALHDALDRLAVAHDFVVIDTPGFDTALSRFAHARADTLVTPLNDSFIDYDVLARIDPETGAIATPSPYALQVRHARRARLSGASRMLDWVIVRNRLSAIGSGNERRVHDSLRLLGMELGFRLLDGITERVAFRAAFHHGLTVLDDLEALMPERTRAEQRRTRARAADEIRGLLRGLNLPVDAKLAARQEARDAWLASFHAPRPVPAIYADGAAR